MVVESRTFGRQNSRLWVLLWREEACLYLMRLLARDIPAHIGSLRLLVMVCMVVMVVILMTMPLLILVVV